VAKTSLTSPPWPEVKLPDPVEEAKHHAAAGGGCSRGLRAASADGVCCFPGQGRSLLERSKGFASLLVAKCERQQQEVLLVGADDFTLLGRPLLGKELVRVEATVVEKTESWPKVHMRFWRRHNYQRKRTIVTPQTVLRINSIEVFPCLA
ncbi:hypothetical protein N307_14977, partial [Dryobates pubescens]